jgi:V8-like Glu-specific endopeptidase
MSRRSKALLVGVAALSLAAPAMAVTGGTLDLQAHAAVGLLLADRGNGPEPDCSGSLVSPTVYVTAAHCTGSLPSNRVFVSFDSQYTAGTSSLFPGTAHTDPLWGTVKGDSHDLAVVVLDAPVTDVTPFALPRAGMLDGKDVRSQTFTNVGYGYADRSFSFDGYRRTSTSSFTTLKSSELQLSDKPGGVCFGDSGGPRLLGNVEVAVTSSGNANCTGQSTSYRLDTAPARAFLSAYVVLP